MPAGTPGSTAPGLQLSPSRCRVIAAPAAGTKCTGCALQAVAAAAAARAAGSGSPVEQILLLVSRI